MWFCFMAEGSSVCLVLSVLFFAIVKATTRNDFKPCAGMNRKEGARGKLIEQCNDEQ